MITKDACPNNAYLHFLGHHSSQCMIDPKLEKKGERGRGQVIPNNIFSSWAAPLAGAGLVVVISTAAFVAYKNFVPLSLNEEGHPEPKAYHEESQSISDENCIIPPQMASEESREHLLQRTDNNSPVSRHAEKIIESKTEPSSGSQDDDKKYRKDFSEFFKRKVSSDSAERDFYIAMISSALEAKLKNIPEDDVFWKGTYLDNRSEFEISIKKDIFPNESKDQIMQYIRDNDYSEDQLNKIIDKLFIKEKTHHYFEAAVIFCKDKGGEFRRY